MDAPRQEMTESRKGQIALVFFKERIRLHSHHPHDFTFPVSSGEIDNAAKQLDIPVEEMEAFIGSVRNEVLHDAGKEHLSGLPTD